MISLELEKLHQTHWNNYSHQFNLTTNEGCGKYTEHWVNYAQSYGWSKVGHLKKNVGQTQYNGHANDAFLYADGTGNPNGLYQSVDLIGSAESTNPNDPPHIFWGVDIPRYTDVDWLATPNSNPTPINMVPWMGYDENSFQKLKQQLAYDYGRRPQGADFDVTVWSARVFHSWYMGPDKTPLGQDAAIKRHRPEWCEALGIPVDNYWV